MAHGWKVDRFTVAFFGRFFQSVGFRSVSIPANIEGFDTLRRYDDHLYPEQPPAGEGGEGEEPA